MRKFGPSATSALYLLVIKMRLKFSLTIFIHFWIVGEISSLKPGACSSRCKSQQLATPFSNRTSCSCSQSCGQFGDCCFDSSFRDADQTAKMPTVCLPVKGNKVYSAIGSCPRSWSSSSEFCLESTGHLPPVTSLSSGATYTNIYCAICNGDYSNITIWKVDLKCCSKYESKIFRNKKRGDTKVGFYFQGHSFWRWIENKGKRSQCPCTFKPRQGKLFVPKSAILRQCHTNVLYLHSSCALHWRGVKTKQYCISYFDPVYVHKRVYRNIHCAICNFDDVAKASCIPNIITLLQRRNMSLKDIREFCKKQNITSCLYYIMSKGQSYAFSELFATSVKKCIPEPGSGRRCCPGWRYDFRSKRCRKTHI